MENLLNTRKVHVVCADNREYNRQASLLEIEELKEDTYCNVKNIDGEITLDFRS